MIRYVHIHFILTCIGISKENKDKSVIIGAGAGVGFAIVILLVIGVIVFMIKRRRDGSPGTIYNYVLQICTYRILFLYFFISLLLYFFLTCTCNYHMTEFNQPSSFPSIFWTKYHICEICIYSCEAISFCSYCFFHPLTVYLLFLYKK
jgi:uncharacterized membrane protein